MTEREIFIAALERDDADERAALLDEACGGDPQLRERVELLLRGHEKVGSFLDLPADKERATIDMPIISEGPGAVIGRYKLLEQIGEGGFGIVFMAEQREPIRRKVALKIIKPGMDSRQVIARFEAERQALAMMDHQSIAKVLDAGTTRNGLPFFVMELVRGIDVIRYSDGHKLSIRERLELFTSVCHAIEHAHQKGIIHRDIKSSNVLVTEQDGKPLPKVIDFGVAKAIGRTLTDRTLYTSFQAVIGTPLYMSPEQTALSNVDVDTRSDVYSLGVLLYELLTGTTPFDKEILQNTAQDEVLRMIREQEPPKPSTKISSLGDKAVTVSQVRRTDAVGLDRLVRGELDWIVMKALEKERDRRYDSANAFGADVQRFLRHEAVAASPPSIGYRLRKWARRNRLTVATAATVALAVLLGLVGTTVGLITTMNERDRVAEALDFARLETRRADDVATDLQQLLYASDMRLAERSWEAGKVKMVRDLLDRHVPSSEQQDLRGFEWHYLSALVSRFKPLRSIAVDELSRVEFGRSGDLAIIKDGRLQLLDPTTSNSKAGYPTDEVFQLSHDGKWAVTWNRQTTNPSVIDLENDRLYRLDESSKPLDAAAISSTGDLAAARTEDGILVLWDVETGDTMATKRGHTGSSIAFRWNRDDTMAFSPASQVVASGGPDNNICIWDWSADSLHILRGHYAKPSSTSGITSLAFSPDGNLLASAGVDRTVRIWDVVENRQLMVLAGHTDEVRAVAFSPDGRFVVSGGRDLSIRVWDIEAGRELKAFSGCGLVSSLAFSPDGETLAAVGSGNSVELYSTDSWGDVDVLWCDRTLFTMAMSPDARLLAAGAKDYCYVKLWRLDSKGTLSQTQEIDIGRPVSDVAISSRQIVAIVSTDGTVEFFDSKSGQKILKCQGSVDVRRVKWGERHPFVFSPDGNSMALGCTDGTIKVWDVDTGDLLSDFPRTGGHILSLAFSKNGRMLVSTCFGSEFVRIWDLENGECTSQFPAQSRHMIAALSPDDEVIATASFGGSYAMWETNTGSPIRAFDGPGATTQIAFLGQRTLVSATRLDLALLDLEDTRRTFTLEGHTGAVWYLSISENGKTIASGGLDGSIRLWRAP